MALNSLPWLFIVWQSVFPRQLWSWSALLSMRRLRVSNGFRNKRRLSSNSWFSVVVCADVPLRGSKQVAYPVCFRGSGLETATRALQLCCHRSWFEPRSGKWTVAHQEALMHLLHSSRGPNVAFLDGASRCWSIKSFTTCLPTGQRCYLRGLSPPRLPR